MADKVRKPTFPFYIVSRRGYDKIYDEKEDERKRTGMIFHGGGVIREATRRKMWWGTSSWHALCKAAHTEGFPVSWTDYAVIPEVEWHSLVARADAVLPPHAYQPKKAGPPIPIRPAQKSRADSQCLLPFMDGRPRPPKSRRRFRPKLVDKETLPLPFPLANGQDPEI